VQAFCPQLPAVGAGKIASGSQQTAPRLASNSTRANFVAEEIKKTLTRKMPGQGAKENDVIKSLPP